MERLTYQERHTRGELDPEGDIYGKELQTGRVTHGGGVLHLYTEGSYAWKVIVHGGKIETMGVIYGRGRTYTPGELHMMTWGPLVSGHVLPSPVLPAPILLITLKLTREKDLDHLEGLGIYK